MAKKAELQEQAKELGLEFTDKNTIADLEKMINSAPKQEEADEAPSEVSQNSETEPKVAKAGKRSAKAVAEAKADDEKEERKAAIKAGEIDESTDAEGNVATKRGPVPVTKTKLERRGKKYKEVASKFDKFKEHSLKEAIDLAIQTSTTNFDSSVELHVRLNVDPKQADQNIRSTVVLPHGTGKDVRVAVFAPVDKHGEAKEAGADIVGEDDFLKQLDKEQYDFDVLVADPSLMAKLGKYAKNLGPKGLMPNPKSGTVTKNIGEAVKKAKAGQVEFRIDDQSIIHQVVGKVSFGKGKLNDNSEILVKAIKDAKPASVKANYILGAHVASSMGPSVKVKL